MAYGGDFGEAVHDGNFVLDGLCFADGTPTPGMVEYAAVIDPLWLETAGSVATGRVMIGNGYDHSELTDVTVEVARQDLDGSWNRSVHHLPDLMQKETRMIPVPTARSGEMVEVTVRTTVVCGNRRTLSLDPPMSASVLGRN